MQGLEHELEETTRLSEWCSEYERQIEVWVYSLSLSHVEYVFWKLCVSHMDQL